MTVKVSGEIACFSVIAGAVIVKGLGSLLLRLSHCSDTVSACYSYRCCERVRDGAQQLPYHHHHAVH